MHPRIIGPWPTLYPRSEAFHLDVDNQPVDVLTTAVAHFAIILAEGPVELRLTVDEPIESVEVQPKRLGATTRMEDRTVTVSLPAAENAFLKIDRLPNLYLFVSPPERNRPDPADPKMHYFRAGQIAEQPCLELEEGETLYLEHGAVLRAAVRAYGCAGLRIAGPGMIDGGLHRRGPYEPPPVYANMVAFENCRDIEFRDTTLVRPCSWTHVYRACENVHIHNPHQIGEGGGNDGIDLMSTRHVTVEGGFIHSGDDCIVIKAQSEESSRKQLDGIDRRQVFSGESAHIEIRGCSLYNKGGGNGLEIGHELRCPSVHAIRFEDIDLLASHGHGAAISLHNCDSAVIEDVLYRNIRIEHHYDKLFSFRITKSRYAFEEAYGLIRNIELRDITIDESPFNAGYTCSVIGGRDAEHPVSDIRFINVCQNGKRFMSFDDFDCYTKHVSQITFE